MHYQHVCLEELAYALPDEVVTSAQLEAQLAPVYQRLHLPEGRLELMTGIRERRFWSAGTVLSDKAIISGEKAISAAAIDREEIGALVHCSVCRDQVEPATACRVHQKLGLSRQCQVFDVSNACLGFLNGLVQAANMIELGQIRAALVVGCEGGRQLVETTVRQLNEDQSLTRQQIKLAVGSLTIGSAAYAGLLVDRELSRTGNRLLGGTAGAYSDHWQLCQGGENHDVGTGMQPLMQTDSERLLHAGVSAAAESFATFMRQAELSQDDIDKTVCHQVGKVHRKALLEALRLDAERDFTTLEFLGNTGSAALPVTAAIAIERGFIGPNENVALLGIGSGVNVMMLAVQWKKSLVGAAKRLPAKAIARA